ncbi:hypothetical protein PPSIR1_24559 [Plesiocystis pacifica SIR-1]|uniref:Uncharacterized protein n=1 Tax=Plesiocystis pacifica SIR-1 TaxID=391625 RepID=A6GGW8_9BACT|nr:hypothetical protein [Plesiocystis pacifica]EDM74909.1 hypothetical protein PPSIR1_24559 [Plesiocystis pacifica SIR-1]
MAGLLPPNPQRVRGARAAGLRPRGRAWGAGLCLLAAGLTGELARSGGLDGALWRALEAQLGGHAGSEDLPAGLLARAASSLAGVTVAAAALILVGLTLGALVAKRRGQGPELRPRGPLALAPDQPRPGHVVALTLVAAAASVAILGPVLAGAARGADASASALTALWLTWIARALGCAGASLALVGLGERWSSGRSLWWALHETPQMRREADRRRGPSRRLADPGRESERAEP